MKATSQIILALAVVLALAGGVFLAVTSLPRDNPPVRIVLPDEPAVAEVQVYVTGAVNAPGVYTLFEGARLADAIEAAGGASDRADVQAVNLALRVKDEDYWHIPELRDAALTTSGAVTRAGVASGVYSVAQYAPDPHSQPAAARLDINSAQVDALMSLPGIGEVRAHAIVRHREQNGDYASVDDLLGVPGIGPATLDAMRDLVEAR